MRTSLNKAAMEHKAHTTALSLCGFTNKVHLGSNWVHEPRRAWGSRFMVHPPSLEGGMDLNLNPTLRTHENKVQGSSQNEPNPIHQNDSQTTTTQMQPTRNSHRNLYSPIALFGSTIVSKAFLTLKVYVDTNRMVQGA
jgi:hypothetical protein